MFQSIKNRKIKKYFNVVIEYNFQAPDQLYFFFSGFIIIFIVFFFMNIRTWEKIASICMYSHCVKQVARQFSNFSFFLITRGLNEGAVEAEKKLKTKKMRTTKIRE